MDFDGATILLTGGTGSFGNAFVTHALKHWPNATVRVFSRDELKQSEMATKFQGAEQVRYLIGDIRDRQRVVRAMQGADIVVHAAAMKQVPACEYNPSEAVQTNVVGSQNIVDAAIDAGVKRVIALSTDKAVNPVNLYGATKLCAEKIFVQGNAYASRSDTVISCVRYGNVIGSRGSVVPVLREQAARGRLLITDTRMTRFWITLDQAIALVTYALGHAEGGEIFIPKIPSMRVTDLAEAIAPGVGYDVVGIRPGEKLHESLIASDDSHHVVETDHGYVIIPEHPWWGVSPQWDDATPVSDGFAYTSGDNDVWLSVDEMRDLLG